MNRFLALLLLASACGPAPAQNPQPADPARKPSDFLNTELPSWLRFSGEFRTRLEAPEGASFRPGNDDSYLLTRLRIGMTIKPSEWLLFAFETQDARANWKNQPAPPYQDTFDLRQAYLDVGGKDEKPFRLRVGRQELKFGDERLLGPTNWSNVARTFDAARLTFRYGRYRVDAFASTVVNARDGEFDESSPGNNLHGLYGSITIPRGVIEPYGFWRLASNVSTESGGSAGLDEKTAGLRATGKLPRGFDYGVEMAFQRGAAGSDRVSSWAGHWLAGYHFEKVKLMPRFFAEFNYATGDRDPADGLRGTFDQLYPSNHDKYGFADLTAWKNIRHLRVAAELHLTRKLTLTPVLNDLALASARDAFYSSSGTVVARDRTGRSGRHIGREAELLSVWQVNSFLQAGAGIAHLFPGEFLKRTTPGAAYTYPYCLLNTRF